MAAPARRRQGPAGVLSLSWSIYLNQLNRRPVRTKAVTAACVAACSDIIVQRLSREARHNWRRTGLLALFGLLWSGPSAHYWQRLQARAFRGKRDLATVVQQTVIDQLSYGPLCNLLFVSYTCLAVDRRPLAVLLERLRSGFVGVQLKGWRVWPLASLVNYRFVPERLRVLFINFVAMGWTVLLLGMTAAKPKPSASS